MRRVICAGVLAGFVFWVDCTPLRAQSTAQGQRNRAFNMPNHVNPGNPSVTLNDPNFGRILSAADPRIMQLALKFVF